jgi:hypothetical protein
MNYSTLAIEAHALTLAGRSAYLARNRRNLFSFILSLFGG